MAIIAAAAVALAPEPGIEYGVSGSFGGMMGRTPIYAGGCNFPYDDPISVPASAKRFYSGIYNAETGERIASLPVETAYGASAQTPMGLVMAGGSTRHCWLLTPRGELLNLPALPFTVDNAYGAAIGNDVYVFGGNQDGKPSTGLLHINLDEGKKAQWQSVSKMPGLPRVQPVMAASGGKLYIWGGFSTGDPKTVHCDGMVYNPAGDTWSPLPMPGSGVTLSGGVAVTKPDGTIVCTGGVNRKIFLDAITAQAPDYLKHKPAWYHFNGKVYTYSPDSNVWTESMYNADRARAGASATLLPDGKVLLMGGEVKPRVRTPRTATF